MPGRLHSNTVPALFFAACSCLHATAEPSNFFNLGRLAPPRTPECAVVDAGLSEAYLTGQFTGGALTVAWVRFELGTAMAAPLFLDVQGVLYAPEPLPGGITMALYNASGSLVALDDRDGNYDELHPQRDLTSAMLSFGSTAYRIPREQSPYQFFTAAGQDGVLPAGVYWLAIAAGRLDRVTAAPTGWRVDTGARYPIGFYGPGEYYLALGMMMGNTTLPPPPPNDLCENATLVGENPDWYTPAWVGSTFGARSEGQFPCVQGGNTPPQDVKDIWFRYVPSRSGYAIIDPMRDAIGDLVYVDRYDGTQACESPSVECRGQSAPTPNRNRNRMFVPVTQGVPVVFAIGTQGYWYSGLYFDINLLPPPRPLSIPAGAVRERESACGQDLNGGCNVSPTAFDALTIGLPTWGTTFTSPTRRDTDWFTFTLTRPSRVTYSYAAQTSIGFSVIRPADPSLPCDDWTLMTRLGLDYDGIGQTFTYREEVDYPAGTYVVSLAPFYFDDLGCGSGYEQYWLKVDATPVPGSCPACVADFNDDGGVDGADLAAFFPAWARAAACADANVDGGVDGGDVEAFFLVWQAGGC